MPPRSSAHRLRAHCSSRCAAGKDSIEKVKHRRPTVATEHLIGKTERRQERISNSLHAGNAWKLEAGQDMRNCGSVGVYSSTEYKTPSLESLALQPAPPLPHPPGPNDDENPYKPIAAAGPNGEGASLGQLWRTELSNAWGFGSRGNSPTQPSPQPQRPPQLPQHGGSVPDADTASISASENSTSNDTSSSGRQHSDLWPTPARLVPARAVRVQSPGALDA